MNSPQEKLMAALGNNEYLKNEVRKLNEENERQRESILILRGEVLGLLKGLKYITHGEARDEGD